MRSSVFSNSGGARTPTTSNTNSDRHHQHHHHHHHHQQTLSPATTTIPSPSSTARRPHSTQPRRTKPSSPYINYPKASTPTVTQSTPNSSLLKLTNTSSNKQSPEWNLDDLFTSYQDSGILPPILSPTLPDSTIPNEKRSPERTPTTTNIAVPKPTYPKKRIISPPEQQEQQHVIDVYSGESDDDDSDTIPLSKHSTTSFIKKHSASDDDENISSLSMLSPTLPAQFGSSTNIPTMPSISTPSGISTPANISTPGGTGAGGSKFTNIRMKSTTIKWINKMDDTKKPKFLVRLIFDNKMKYKRNFPATARAGGSGGGVVKGKPSSPVKLNGLGISIGATSPKKEDVRGEEKLKKVDGVGESVRVREISKEVGETARVRETPKEMGTARVKESSKEVGETARVRETPKEMGTARVKESSKEVGETARVRETPKEMGTARVKESSKEVGETARVRETPKEMGTARVKESSKEVGETARVRETPKEMGTARVKEPSKEVGETARVKEVDNKQWQARMKEISIKQNELKQKEQALNELEESLRTKEKQLQNLENKLKQQGTSRAGTLSPEYTSTSSYEEQKKRERLKKLTQDVINREQNLPIEDIIKPIPATPTAPLSKSQREEIKLTLQDKKSHYLQLAKSAKSKSETTSDEFLSILIEIDSIILRLISADYDERSKIITQILPSERSWKILDSDIESLISRIKQFHTSQSSTIIGEFLKILTCILYQTRGLVLKRTNAILNDVINHYLTKNDTGELDRKIIELQRSAIANSQLILQYFMNSKPGFLDSSIATKFPGVWYKKSLDLKQVQEWYNVRDYRGDIRPREGGYYLPLGGYSNLNELTAVLYGVVMEFVEIYNKYNSTKPITYVLQSGQ
ncbi:uncharacterized protein J8A68_001274 [[Candida] subhashii]|uniref:Uncharacterized protein n=1 Tax=[Candida] subhashii TaxID=561895 RepID=A0A8J5QP10_9ASCO|nr:uncharacterized protein J8A68_001274 [[Candida] subhashii]KAG7665218.1 hypothetical protein J8A68_001274 [[Candida] subhashii]